MISEKLMVDLIRLGIRLKVDGDQLRYHPRSAVTPCVTFWLSSCIF